MSTFAVPQIPTPPDTDDVKVLREYVQQLANITAMAMKELDWLINGNISSQNTREIAGYNISSTELKHKSGIVGMSGYDASNPLAVRFWAGNAIPASAPFRVQQDGAVKASDIIITGGSINVATDATIGNNLNLGVSNYTGSKRITWSSDVGIVAYLDVTSGNMEIRTDGFITLTIGSAQGLVVNKVVAASALKSNTITNNSGVSVVFSGTTTSSTSVSDSHNHGFTSSDYIQCYDSGGVATVKKQWVPYAGSASHSHTVT